MNFYTWKFASNAPCYLLYKATKIKADDAAAVHFYSVHENVVHSWNIYLVVGSCNAVRNDRSFVTTGLGQYASSHGNRTYCYAELAVSSLAVAEAIASTHYA